MVSFSLAPEARKSRNLGGMGDQEGMKSATKSKRKMAIFAKMVGCGACCRRGRFSGPTLASQ